MIASSLNSYLIALLPIPIENFSLVQETMKSRKPMGHRRFKFWNRYLFPVLLVMGKQWTFLGGLRSDISIFGSFKLKLPIANPNKEVRICTDPILQSIFEEADDDDDPGLDMEEFRVAMRRAMGPHLSDDEIDAIFMKV